MKKDLPNNVLRLLADKAEIVAAMRRYTIGRKVSNEVAYNLVIDEVSEHLDEDQRPWQPYSNYESFKTAFYRGIKVERKRNKRK